MFAVIGNVGIDADRVAEAEAMLHQRLLPAVKEMAGFVSGTWTRALDDASATSMVIFDDEESARAAVEAAKGLTPPPEAPITFGTFDVVRVIVQA